MKLACTVCGQPVRKTLDLPNQIGWRPDLGHYVLGPCCIRRYAELGKAAA